MIVFIQRPGSVAATAFRKRSMDAERANMRMDAQLSDKECGCGG